MRGGGRGGGGSLSQGLLERWAATEASARSELARADALLRLGMEEVLGKAQVRGGAGCGVGGVEEGWVRGALLRVGMEEVLGKAQVRARPTGCAV